MNESTKARMPFVPTVVCVVFSLTCSVSAAPRAELWARWQQRDPNQTQTIDHRLWDTFLRTYVETSHPSGINRLRYAHVTAADRQALHRYLSAMQAVPISTYKAPEQKAYWINLYNALTVSIVLEHYPVASIRDIDLSPGLFSNGPWQAKLLTIEGEQVSLDDIEHRILRPIWQDNRIHYAVNCASLGCSNLVPVAYTAANIETLLEQGARDYVNHPRGVSFDQDSLVVSSLYLWFKADFGGGKDGIIRHIRHYAGEGLAARLQTFHGRLKHRYDWRLNAP